VNQGCGIVRQAYSENELHPGVRMTSSRGPLNLRLDPESINELSRDYWNSAILRAGIKLRVFALLEEEPMTFGEVAERIQAAPRFVEAFLNAATVLGLLEQTGQKYQNSQAASQYLIEEKPEYVGDLVLHITNHWTSWGQLDQLIKQGRTLLPFDSGYVDVNTYWNDYMMGQHNRATAGQGEQLVKSVDLSDRRKLLDLGGGAGSYSIALCAANPDLYAVVVDQAEPLVLARSLVEQHHLQNRLSLQEGDFNSVTLETDYDVVLISGVVLIKSAEECKELFRRAHAALKPGGMVIVQDFMKVDNGARRTFMDTLMDMYVLIAFDPGAGDREGQEVVAWLEEAGFRQARTVALPTHLALVIAERPSRVIPSRPISSARQVGS